MILVGPFPRSSINGVLRCHKRTPKLSVAQILWLYPLQSKHTALLHTQVGFTAKSRLAEENARESSSQRMLAPVMISGATQNFFSALRRAVKCTRHLSLVRKREELVHWQLHPIGIPEGSFCYICTAAHHILNTTSFLGIFPKAYASPLPLRKVVPQPIHNRLGPQ